MWSKFFLHVPIADKADYAHGMGTANYSKHRAGTIPQAAVATLQQS